MTLLDLFDGACADRPDALAVDDLSYRELDRASRNVAAHLRAQGVVAGDRIAIFSENRIGFVYVYLAAQRLGAILVPANVLYRASDLAHVVQDAGARLVVVSAASREHVEALEQQPDILAIEDVERWAQEHAAFNAPLPSPDAVALIIYTSGTTGRSKGAMLTHGNLAAVVSALASAWRWTPTDTLAIALPLFHVHGLIAALSGTLAAGAHILIHERFRADAMLDVLRRDDVTMFFGVPTMYVRLLETLGDGVPPRLRLCVSGSAALSADVHRAFSERFGLHILERYGATEFGFALGNRYGGPRVPGSVGIPFSGVRVCIAEPNGTTVLPPDTVGEVLVAGPTVFAGYWNDPVRTADAFVTIGGTLWYRSGDLGVDDAATQTYRIVGRLKELIITGGFNVYPLEVEAEIDRFPGVRASAVIGIADAARGELPVAFLECESPVDTTALAAHLAGRLASFKLPKAFHIVDALPRNALGKVEKAKLRTAAVT